MKEQREQFERWIRDYGTLLHHVVNGFAAGDDRKDLMQELMLAVWKSIPAFRHHSRAATFLYRVTHNAAMTWKRAQRNYQARVERFQAQAQAEAEPAMPGFGHEQELLERLYREIRKLPPLDRSLALLALEGVSYEEMAAIHGLTCSNVGVRIHRLKQKLAQAMKGARA